MEELSVRFYQKEDYALWNNFVNEAKNSTFLFQRDFMEYHQHRYRDFSLMVFQGRKLVAVLPANIDGAAVHSHQGLTYGGILVKPKMRSLRFFDIFKEILSFLNDKNIKDLYIKELPHFYAPIPNDEWKYLAFICKAELYRRDLCSVVHLKKSPVPHKMVYLHPEILEAGGISYKKSEIPEEFWQNILCPELTQHHNAIPVHSFEEISILAKKFPENIGFYGVYNGEELIGGTVLFLSNNVAHCQYISIKSQYRKSSLLHYLHYKLITEVFADFDYFDFGISNEQAGTKLNRGLMFWKETFGARSVAQDFYRFPTASFHLIDEMYL